MAKHNNSNTNNAKIMKLNFWVHANREKENMQVSPIPLTIIKITNHQNNVSKLKILILMKQIVMMNSKSRSPAIPPNNYQSSVFFSIFTISASHFLIILSYSRLYLVYSVASSSHSESLISHLPYKDFSNLSCQLPGTRIYFNRLFLLIHRLLTETRSLKAMPS